MLNRLGRHCRFFGMPTPASKLLLRHLEYFKLAGLLDLGAALGLLPVVILQFRKTNFALDRKNLSRLAGAIVFGGGSKKADSNE